MRILVTGGEGFLGKIIVGELESAGHNIKTLGRGINNDLIHDLSSERPFSINDDFDLVVHCAGKAHTIPRDTAEGQDFIKVNVTGTERLLGSLKIVPKQFVFISSVAVYGLESGMNIDEDAMLLAENPYGKSKVEAERIVQRWCAAKQVKCTILRLPLIAAPNPPGNLSTMISGIKKNYYFNIAGGRAKKSIVLATDVAKLVIKASMIGGIYNLTDGYNPSFAELSENISRQLGKPSPINIPYWLAAILAKVGDLLGRNAPINSQSLKKIVSDLTFSDNKATNLLMWQPNSVLEDFKIN